MAAVNLLDLVRDLWGDSFSISRWYIPGHDGVDLPAKVGTPVRAVASGTVSFAKDARLLSSSTAGKGWAIGGGNVVNIDVSNKLTTQYAHLDTILVREGQYVKQGDIIGRVGKTGGLLAGGAQGGAGAEFFGAHLHFGLWNRTTNKMVNPTTFLLAQRAGWGSDIGAIGNPMGGWGVPEGTILTRKIVDEIIARMDAAGLFRVEGVSNPVSEAMAIDTTRKLLYAQIGKPWTQATSDPLQGEILKAAQQADALGSLAGSVATIVGKLSDPGNWARILALLVGVGVAGYGGINVLRATAGVSVPARF